MEAPMTRTRRPLLDVQESFEVTRLSPKCLIEAYSRVVPIQRKAIDKGLERAVAAAHNTMPPKGAAPRRHRRNRGGEHV
jgi:hypothetical protein